MSAALHGNNSRSFVSILQEVVETEEDVSFLSKTLRQLEEALHNFCHHSLYQPEISRGPLCSPAVPAMQQQVWVGVATGDSVGYSCGATLYLSCHACNEQQISV